MHADGNVGQIYCLNSRMQCDVTFSYTFKIELNVVPLHVFLASVKPADTLRLN